ncbi:MAG: GDP-mannose 4,6-dehydratase [Acidimicrobiia bacterium]|nr:GDP-mannose 4,6-dehydratase [Acidimicrobiia bacterium]
MKALVTGGAGFIGSNLVDRLLAEDHQVDVIDDLSSGSLANLADARAGRTKRLSFHQVDVRDAGVVELIERRRPDVVFHLAARDPIGELAPEDVVDDAEVAVVGSLRVLEGARRAGSTKVVAASNASIYRPPTGSELPLRESHPQHPVDPDGVARKAVADYLAVFRERHELEFTALALANVYGPRQRSGVVAELVERVVAGERCTIDGDGLQTRDFVFVDDVVDAFVRAAERGSGLVVNVGTGIETSVNDLHDALQLAAGGSEGVAVERRPARAGRVPRLALDPGRARIHLGWTPWTDLADGLVQTVESRRAT